MTPRQALQELLGQHSELRRIMDVCELLADQLDAGQIESADLEREVVRLRVTFDGHNEFEEKFLRPILREVDVFGEIRLDQMVADHVREHRLTRGHLESSVTAELRLTLQGLRAHLETEERHFLSATVLGRVERR